MRLTTPRLKTRRPNRRRGVLLLIVLSLLILFVLIGITFIVVAGQYRQTSLHEARHNRTGDAPRRIFDFTVYQLLRGAPDRQSILGRHSLLEDLYGRDGFRGVTEAITAQYGGQLLTIRVHVDPASSTPALSLTNHYYAGSVLTFVDGPYAHESLRIMDSQVITGTDAIDLACDGSTIKLTGTNPLPLVARVVVNGKAFNGAGATLVDETPSDPTTQLTLSSFQYLHPNFQAYYHEDELNLFTNASPLGAPYLGKTPFDADIQVGNPLNLALYGGDESWDAVDPLNMHMSLLTPNDPIGTTGGRFYTVPIGYGPPVADPNFPADVIIPSFHRPLLVNFLSQYWLNALSSNPANPDWAAAAPILEHELHLSVLRPLPGPNNDADENVHPNFTGSNPAATWIHTDSDEANLKRLTDFLVYGPWDVDNDGDLVPDSIWLDIGLPPQRTPDGVLYKPLVAVLLRDLDGRININTAGIVTDNTQTFGPEFTALMAGSPTHAVNFNSIPRGSGYGPAEIGQYSVLPSNVTEKNVIDSRNVDQTYPPSFNPTIQQPPGLPGEDRIVPLAWEQATNWEYNAIPLNHADINQQVHGFLSPPDLLGKGRLFLDHAGQPYPALMGVGVNEKYDDPYEANLIDDPWTDSLFTDREMEAVLRGTEVFSPDSNARTLALISNQQDWARLRHEITTRSFDIPVPNQQVPEEFRNLTYPALPDPNARPVRSLVDLYYARLATIGGLAGPAIDLQIQQLFPFEMLRGGKFNINRPFGNGRDDDAPGELGFGVADEPDEKRATAPVANDATNGLRAMDGTTVVSERQIFARQLYCLMLMLTRDDYRAPEFGTENAQVQLEMTRRQLAQWAINVVDFRDPDAIMTPFEYDVNPYDGWQVDDNPETVDTVPDRRLVWGQEYSELMLTEAVAFHDRRVRDTDIDDGVDPRDPADMSPFTRYREVARDGLDPDDPTVINDDDLDQVAMPQGSLFLEFYCPRSPIAGATTLPRELYSIVNDSANGIFNEPHLDLGRLAPANVRGVRAPVWRVAISEVNSAEFQAYQTFLDKRYPITSFDSPTSTKEMIWDLGVTNSTPNRITLERFVWFTPYDPTTTNSGDVLSLAGKNDSEVYFNHNGSLNPSPAAAGANAVIQSSVLLKPNRYCVVGPRIRTDLGATSPGFDDGGNPAAPGTYYPGDQRFVFAGGLFAGGFNTSAQQATPVDASNASIPAGEVLGITAGAYVPSSWASTPPAARQSVGLSVSEPLPQSGQYYEQPPATPVFANLPEAYGDPTKARAVGTNTVPDTPFDGQPNTPLQGITQTGTTVTNFRVVFVQRLANPLKPWNPVPNPADAEAWNPYITVDWMPIDLTVFNGMEDNDRQIRVRGQDEWIDPADPNPFATAPDEAFESREKGDPRSGFQYVLFTGVAMPPRSTARAGGGEFFNVNMNHTLGFLNRVDDPGGMPWFAKNPYNASNPPSSPLLMRILGHYAASPEEPFPWYTWNNRPFVSHLELLQVPKTPSATAYLQFSPAMGKESRPNNDPVDGSTPIDSLGVFTHLLNFHHSRAPGSAAAANSNNYPDFSRLLDYVEVPSPYAGTRKWFNPANHVPNTVGVGVGYQNPFAYVSRFRDPGKVNLNTLHEGRVWEGLTFRHPESLMKWVEFQQSRRGAYTLAPTLFANPYRSSASADLMPIIRDPRNPTTTLLDMRQQSADVSLLRRVGGSTNTGVFEPTLTNLERYVDPDRSSHFHYEGAQRLGNLTTTHSNVYACWITVGYFELEQARDPNSGQRVGEYNRLGQEVGTDTGEVKRHRAFFMIDRSIPVGFEVGQNHNVDKCIVLRRYLEQQ